MGNTESRKDLEPIFEVIAAEYDPGFAVNLYKQVVGKSSADGQNFLMSPLNVARALAMAGTGAKGKTLDEIHDCLKSPKGEAMHQFFYQIKTAVMKSEADDEDLDGPEPALLFANGLWLEKSLHLRRAFELLVKKSYGTDPTVADFRGKAEEERMIVNKWVWKVTGGKFQDLLPPGSLNHETRIVLANTLYFKGTWSEIFHPEETIFEDFHLLDGETVSVPFMTSSKTTHYIESFENYKVLKLPYFQGYDQRSFSMLFLLPDAKDGIVQLQEKLDAKTLTAQFNSIHKRKVGKLRLPKFRISSGFTMKDALQGLGVNSVFSKGADFTDMVECQKDDGSDNPPNADELYLTDVFHKCFIEVNEWGTDVSAAAAGVMVEAPDDVKYPPAMDFVADHPFLFLLKEENTGVIVFIGRITNPSLPE